MAAAAAAALSIAPSSSLCCRNGLHEAGTAWITHGINKASWSNLLLRSSNCVSRNSSRMPRVKQLRVRAAGISGSQVLELNPKTFKGQASPLGVSKEGDVINFALFSEHASSVTLCLRMAVDGGGKKEIPLNPRENKTGNVWHIALENIPTTGVLYGYRVDGQGWEKGNRFDKSLVLIDPYAKLVEGRRLFGDKSQKNARFWGTYDFDEPEFDWDGDESRTRVAEKDLVIYEMNVRGFTIDKSSGIDEQLRGSYLGVIEKIPHLVELGVTAVELLPVFEYDELEFQRVPNSRDHMINVWGYSTINFFSPMSRYASAGRGPLAASLEFKKMVKALHKAGIEVILDVVYNHTNEGSDRESYTTSFRGIDNQVYYMMDSAGYMNFSGCGNTLNCNHPVVKEFVLDSLRHWVKEYHVDGFRFDLASVLCRGTNGAPLAAPPLIKEICHDPVLAHCKLIAEPWDCGGLYLVGCFPNWDRWAEWNGKYRDDMRRFIKGDAGLKSVFASRFCGSSDLYNTNKRKPYHSINFIVAHDGFTLYDLVAYNLKHNDANGERGQDGCNDNFSWNCGHEGETQDAGVNGLRARQMKNFHVALMLSQGTPMMIMGDEYAHTKHGNNNTYGHDGEMNNFIWSKLAKKRDHFEFFSKVIKFRLAHPIFGRTNFLSSLDVTWHEDNWHNYESRFLAFTLHERENGDVYMAFNAHSFAVNVTLPSPPTDRRWYRLVDTNLPGPNDFVREGVPGIKQCYNIAPFSAIALIAKP